MRNISVKSSSVAAGITGLLLLVSNGSAQPYVWKTVPMNHGGATHAVVPNPSRQGEFWYGTDVARIARYRVEDDMTTMMGGWYSSFYDKVHMGNSYYGIDPDNANVIFAMTSST
jgi:hypothetical protein